MADDADPLAQIEDVESSVLGSKPSLTRAQVADEAGVPLELAEELWGQLGFPHTADDDVAFTRDDVKALVRTNELVSLGILTPDSQSALVRTWGRSFARLAEWQVNLLAEVAVEGPDPTQRLNELMDVVLPNVEQLQSYIWRRHLASAANRLMATATADGPGITAAMAVVFVDIVGYTEHSKNLTDRDLVDWVEHFEDEMTRTVVDHGGRVIKTIGDEILFVTDDSLAAANIALSVTERGEDVGDRFPQVRTGIAYGEVVSRLGDVFGPTVNIASRLTSVARPGTVLVDRGAYETLSGSLAAEVPDEVAGQVAGQGDAGSEAPPRLSRIIGRAADELSELSPYSEGGGFRFRRMARRSVKGYSRLEPWVLRRAKVPAGGAD